MVKSPDIKARLLEMGVVPEGDSPASFAAYVKADIAKWKRVIEQAQRPENLNPGRVASSRGLMLRSRARRASQHMRIVDIRETAIPLKSDLRNSGFDFSEMTTSVVAVITDVIRDGKPVAGFAFNSTGRYACGAQMRARFIPRILKADPKSLMNEAGDNLDPEKILAVMMRNEKSGGHSERSVGIGTIEVAVWDAIAKIEGKPLHRVLAERYNGGKVVGQGVLLRRRRLVRAGQDHQGPAGRDAAASRFRLHHGEDEGRRRDARRGHEPHRGGEDGRRQSRHSSRSTPTASSSRDEAIDYAKAMSPYKLRWYEEPCDPLDFATLPRHLRRL